MTPEGLEKTEEIIGKDEGYKSHPYRCPAGKLTIGRGYNLTAHGIDEEEAKRRWPNGMTVDEADELMKQEIQDIIKMLSARLPLFNTLSDVRQSVLINMAYQMGIKGLCAFKDTLEYLRTKQYTRAASEMLNSDWYRKFHDRASRLHTMMWSSKWPIQ